MNHIVKKWLTICLLCFAASVVSYAQIGEAWYMRSYAQNSWTSISGNILNFGQYSFVTGNNMTGVIVCGGPTNRSMMYSLNYTG